MENNDDFVKIAAVEIQVRVHLDNSNVVPDGIKGSAAAELTKKHIPLGKVFLEFKNRDLGRYPKIRKYEVRYIF